jgi:hypothetical protein
MYLGVFTEFLKQHRLTDKYKEATSKFYDEQQFRLILQCAVPEHWILLALDPDDTNHDKEFWVFANDTWVRTLQMHKLLGGE